MKIRNLFHLLVAGIVLIPILIFNGTAIYLKHIYASGKYNEEFNEFLRFRELINFSETPVLMRFFPVAFFLLITIFVIVMAALIARSITRSVAAIEDTTRRIADGELDLTVDVKGSNEITSLSNSFNKMRIALKKEEQRRYFFIMGITHDLKTPLALIKANVEAIEDGIAVSPEEQKHFLNVVNNKVDELEGMINNLLDFVRVDSKDAKRNMSMTSLQSFLSSYIERVAIDAELLHHKVESNINLPVSLSINMDSFLIQRALDNIVNNCFRYTPNDTCLSISADYNNSFVCLNISDNGNGIDEKDLPFIFDVFYRGSASRGEQGIGLGLAVAKSIFDSHGWSIAVSARGESSVDHSKVAGLGGGSETEKGTCFNITIPLKQGV